MYRRYFSSLHVVAVLSALVTFIDVSFAEETLTPNEVAMVSNKSSVPATQITCDAIPNLPSNETFCVCRLSDTQALLDLRCLAWTLSDPQRKGPSLYTEDPWRPWAACSDAGFARFDNNTRYCEKEWSHTTSYFKVSAKSRRVVLKFRNTDGTIGIVIRLECDRSKEAASPEFRFLKRNREYNFKVYELRSTYCCENGCTGAPQPPTSDPPPNYGMISGIAVGGVAGIVMLVLVGVTAVKKCRRPGPGNLPVEREEEDNYPPLLRGARAEPVEA